MTTATRESISRNEATKAIRSALRARSGKSWSCSGGTGTSWGWLRISAPPARLVDYEMTEADRVELAELLDLECVHSQGQNVPAGGDFYREYIARAEGRTPEVYGVRYWD